MNIGYIVLGIIAVVALWVVFAYNRFVTFVNRVKEAWADIDVQLKRRYDLIPNLVASVKGYAAHEAGTLQKVTDARTKAMGSSSSVSSAGVAGAFASAIAAGALGISFGAGGAASFFSVTGFG